MAYSSALVFLYITGYYTLTKKWHLKQISFHLFILPVMDIVEIVDHQFRDNSKVNL